MGGFQFTAEVRHLAAAVASVRGAGNYNGKIPILGHLLVEGAGATARVKATDLELMLEEEIAADVGGEGGICIPGNALHDLLRNLNSGSEISLTEEHDGHSVRIRSGRADFDLNILPAVDFPRGSLPDSLGGFEAEGAALANGLDTVSTAASTTIDRPHLCGVCVEPLEGHIRLTATGGVRLVSRDVDATIVGAFGGPAGTDENVILPLSAIPMISKLTKKADRVRVEFSDRHCRIVVGSTKLVTKLVDGVFPAWRNLFRRDGERSIIVDAAELQAAIRRVLAVYSGRTRMGRVTLLDNTITIRGIDDKLGEAKDTIDLVSRKGDDDEFEVGLNLAFIDEMIDALQSERLEFAFMTRSDPVRIYPAQYSGQQPWVMREVGLISAAHPK